MYNSKDDFFPLGPFVAERQQKIPSGPEGLKK
jgi:hypothetical protein